MNHFKRGIAVGLVFAIFLTTLLGNATSFFLQSEIRKEVSALWNELIQDELVEIEVSQKVAAKIQATKSREFYFKNQWYDVVSVRKVNEKWMLTCYSDGKETDLENNRKQSYQKQQITFDWISSQVELPCIAIISSILASENKIVTPIPQLVVGIYRSCFSPPELLG